MAEKIKKKLDDLYKGGFLNTDSKNTHLDSLKKLEEETKKLEEEAKEKEQRNNELLAKLPKGLIFEVGNFVIQT